MPKLRILAILLALPGSAFAQVNFDATLAPLMKAAPAAELQSRAKIGSALLRTHPKSGDSLVQTIVRFKGDGLAQLAAQGAIVRSVLGDIATVDVPLTKLAAVAALPDVLYIEAAKPLVSRLNASVPATKADTLRSGTAPNWTGVTGKGVIVGIIDDGLDFRHKDFRNVDGTTRLLALWDQRDSGTAGSPPSGFSYGGECTQTMLNAAITAGVSSTACTQPSTGNHGTHVGGIAAGNGSATGNNLNAYRFVGMAPEADLLAANSIGGGISASNAVLDAVAWMKAKAKAAGKPLVINLSLGSYFGNRDGTGNYERGLSNAGEAGVILVGAAGNEGDAKIRATGSISEGQTVDVKFNVPSGRTSDRLEMWYPGTNQYAVKLSGPNGCTTTTVNAGTTDFSATTPCATISISNGDVNTANDDRQMLVNLSAASITSGEWTLSITGTKATAGSTFSVISGEQSSAPNFTNFTENVTAQILTDTSSGTDVIAVGATVSKTSWDSLAGAQSDTSNGSIGDITGFSSRGPRRNCSNATKCPPVMKPELAAPGSAILSALGQDASSKTQTSVEADGVHTKADGTSMATPHVAGAIALLLQKNPKLTPADVKKALLQNVQTNSFTGSSLPKYDPTVAQPSNPNYTFGYGILDAAKAYAAVSGTTTTTVTDSDAANHIFNWAEVQYASLLSPKGGSASGTFDGYIFRAYNGPFYVGLKGGVVYYFTTGMAGPAAAGTTADLYKTAVGAGF